MNNKLNNSILLNLYDKFHRGFFYFILKYVNILMNLLNRINAYLFIEDKKEYINLNSIKIDINEESGPYLLNQFINIECTFDKDIFNKALSLLKYEKFMDEYNETLDPKTGRCYINKKNIVSDVILYVSKFDSNDQLKIIELKNVMINCVNMEENTILLICDYYIRFNDFLEIDDKEYLCNIYNLININYNKTYNAPYLGIDLLNHNNSEINDEEDNYDYDWDDYDYIEYQKDNEEGQDLFERSSQLISKIFSKFYK